jgi:O-antigen ligase
MQWITGAFCVMIWISLALNSGLDINDKSFFKTHWFQIILCTVLLLFGVSANDSLWPWQYLLVFGSLSFISIKNTEKELIFHSLLVGIIISFVIIQGLAFAFRPFDTERYKGLYGNTNINALFYLVVYCTFLILLCAGQSMPNKRKRYIVTIFSVFMSSSMLSFVLLTSSRTAFMAMLFASLIAFFYIFSKKKKLRFIKSSALFAGIVLCMFVSFPLVYSFVRYIPCFFHHPIWFYDEYAEWKVHSWDPWNSPKYTPWQIVIYTNLNRLFQLFGLSLSDISINLAPPITSLKNKAMLLASTQLNGNMLDVLPTEPLIEYTDRSAPIRIALYKYYLSNLNLVGHLNSAHGVQVTSGYFAPHAHNLYLQFAFNFGAPAGILFVLFTLMTLFGYIKKGFSSKTVDTWQLIYIGCAIFYIGILTFGMTEIMWINGQFPFVLLFLLPALIPPFAKNRISPQSQESLTE